MGHEDIQGRVAGDTDFQADGKPVACGGGDGSCCLNRVIHRPAQQKLVLVRAAGRQVACHRSVLPLLSEALLSVESGSPANRARGAGKRRVGRARPLLSALADPSHLERSYLARLRGEAGTYSSPCNNHVLRQEERGISECPLCCGAMSVQGLARHC